MKIKLIANSTTTSGNTPLSKVAWCESRSWEDETSLEKILSIDAPVNDFPSLVLNIESSVMVREVIASMRGHVMWARTSRVDDPLDFEVEEVLSQKQHEEVEDLRLHMSDLKDMDTRQDEYRLLAPVISKTSYSIRISLRSIIKLYHYFTKLSDELSGISSAIFHEAAHTFIRLLAAHLPRSASLMEVVNSYRIIELMPVLKDEDFGIGKVGDFIVLTVTIPFSLRTHLIRHNSLHIKDNLIEFFDDKDIHKKTIKDNVNVQISASTSFWTHVLKERSCWMAHYSMWKAIMEKLNGVVHQDESFLPCGGCGDRCPYVADAQQRVEGKDPNPPCPIYTQDNGIELSIEQGRQIVHMFEDDQRPQFWRNRISNLRLA